MVFCGWMFDISLMYEAVFGIFHNENGFRKYISSIDERIFMSEKNEQYQASSDVPPLISTQNGTLQLHDITIIDQSKLSNAV